MEEYKKETMLTYAVNPVAYEKKTRENLDKGIRVRLERFSSLLNGKKVLDIGCGPGVHVEWFREKGFDAIGIDLSDAFLQLCSEKGLNVRKMDMENINFWPHSFDGIWAVSSLLHLPKEKIPRVVKSWARLLKPNGVLFVSVKEGEGEGYRQDMLNGGRNKWMSYFSEEELKNLFSGSFDVIERGITEMGDGVKHIDIFFRVRSH